MYGATPIANIPERSAGGHGKGLGCYVGQKRLLKARKISKEKLAKW